MPCLRQPLRAPASDMVMTSAPGRPAPNSCMKRRSTASPPERSSVTLMPVSCCELVGELLRQRERRRGVPAQAALLTAAASSAWSNGCADAGHATASPTAATNSVRDLIVASRRRPLSAARRRCRHGRPGPAKVNRRPARRDAAAARPPWTTWQRTPASALGCRTIGTPSWMGKPSPCAPARSPDLGDGGVGGRRRRRRAAREQFLHRMAGLRGACARLRRPGGGERVTPGTWRSDPRLASGLNCTAQVVAFAAVGAPLSYIAASANLPLQDHTFDLLDRALGTRGRRCSPG